MSSDAESALQREFTAAWKHLRAVQEQSPTDARALAQAQVHYYLAQAALAREGLRTLRPEASQLETQELWEELRQAARSARESAKVYGIPLPAEQVG
jgi:hypothetical protein